MADIKVKESTIQKQVKRDYIYAIGKRREASARVRLYQSVKQDLMWGDQQVKKDQILVNEMPIEHYFPGPIAKARYIEPLMLTDSLQKYAITIKVSGGGRKGQLDAVIKGIAHALILVDIKSNRSVLKAKGFLTRDSRIRERRKVGTGGKARRQKQSPKR